MSKSATTLMLIYAVWNLVLSPTIMCSAEEEGKMSMHPGALTKRMVYPRDIPIFPVAQYNEDAVYPVYPPVISVGNSPSNFLNALGPYYKGLAQRPTNDFIDIVHLLSMLRRQREIPSFSSNSILQNA
uniref:Uncharacterized protein n=1 Tax=Trichuris muris TaxID=70415 RepID=A0A5S6QVJ8_TRIMR